MNTIQYAAAAVLVATAALPAQAGELILPDFHLSDFHAPLRIDNPLSPMKAGTFTVAHELEDGECKVNDVIITDRSKHDFIGIYAGLSARVVRDLVYQDEECNGKRGLLLEDTSDFYGQDDSGNVWYFGEETVEYEYDDKGKRISSSTEGSWEAGRDAKAGIVMFADPQVDVRYRQEFSPGVAEDNAKVKAIDIHVNTSLGSFKGCVKTRETTPLSPGDVEFKYYCPNIGLVKVVSPTVDGGAETVRLGVH
ncbi:hypothetical protein GCM10027431_15530 [Lysobacter rhizosphaerae]